MQSQKRPLEDPSTDSGPGDQHDAKRPALDNAVKEEDGLRSFLQQISPCANVILSEIKEEDNNDSVNGTSAGDMTATSTLPSASAVLETQPIQSTTSGGGTSQGPFNGHQDETGWLHVRAIISSAEAATVIGKGGENVSLIRRLSGAKCTVSDYSRGAVERILTVSGLVDAVAKVSSGCPISITITLSHAYYLCRLLV